MLATPYRTALQTWEIGTSTSLIEPSPTHVQQCKDAGLQCIEIVLNPGENLSIIPAKRIATWSHDAGLRIHSVHLPYGHRWDISQIDDTQRQQAISDHKQLLAMTASWGAQIAVIHPSYEPIQDSERQARLRNCRKSLLELASVAKQYEMTLAVECLPRTCLGNTSEEIVFLTEGNHNIGICCDVNHLFQESPEHFIRTVGNSIITVHMSDNDGVDEKHWLPGTGVINWKEVLTALVDIEYTGPFLFEARGTIRGTPLAAHHLQEWWQQMIAE